MTYHSLVPDDGHPLLGPVGSLRDQGKVVLPNSFLSSVEGAVGTASNLEVSAGKRYQQMGFVLSQPFASWHDETHLVMNTKSSTHQDSSELRKSGVVGSGLSGGEVTKAAAFAQFLLQ